MTKHFNNPWYYIKIIFTILACVFIIKHFVILIIAVIVIWGLLPEKRLNRLIKYIFHRKF